MGRKIKGKKERVDSTYNLEPWNARHSKSKHFIREKKTLQSAWLLALH
jgi:hypothetical protein